MILTPNIGFKSVRGKSKQEPPSPNLLQQPNNFTNSIWSKTNVTINSTNNLSPDNTNNATEIFLPDEEGRLVQLINRDILQDDVYTVSVWLRTISGTGECIIGFNGLTNGDNNRVRVVDLTEQWQRFSYTNQFNANDTGMFVTVSANRFSGQGGLVFRPEITLQVYNGKVEEGSSAT